MGGDRLFPGAVGLVLARPPRLIGVEPFFMEFIAGVEERLVERDRSLLLHVVATQDAESAVYRRWREQGMVEAVVVVNRTADDPRPGVLRAIGLPAVLVGEPAAGLPCVRTDDAAGARAAAQRLLALGHRRVARVSGPAALLHTRARTAAVAAACAAAGAPEPLVVEGDYSEESGAKATAALLRLSEPPTAVLYDNDVMAVAGLAAAKDLGVAVPGGLSILAWDDSSLCRLASPALSVMSVDVHRFGGVVAEAVLDLLDLPAGAAPVQRWSPAAAYLERGSTAPPGGT
ncbi:LacI family DNA-binding transcriptional regulator [Actinokineospora guangxiensis]|uniref:LacI family DNA-binding transcriptional regulator n=1 Tax=Actinokineospora guangxiensis TaxID=1490288 RepID=A0ABW0EPQ1_9PSEU